MGIRQSVSSDLGGGGSGGNNIQKIDTENLSADDKEIQGKVLEAIESGENLDEETVIPEGDVKPENSDEKSDENPDGESSNDDKPDENKSDEEDFGYIEEENKEDKEDKGDENVNIEKIKEEAKKEAFDEFVEKYNPNAQKSENIRLHRENQKLLERSNLNAEQFLVSEKENEIFGKFFENHKDILPQASKDAFFKFRNTGDEKFVFDDPVLSKLDTELRKIAAVNPENILLDLNERLESAYKLAFHDKIVENTIKQAQAREEMKRQEIEKAVETGGKNGMDIKSKGYTPEQQKVADAWGVKL